jgi:hypothetical protein
MIRVRFGEKRRHPSVPALQGPDEGRSEDRPGPRRPGTIAYECPSCGYVTSVLIDHRLDDQ